MTIKENFWTLVTFGIVFLFGWFIGHVYDSGENFVTAVVMFLVFSILIGIVVYCYG